MLPTLFWLCMLALCSRIRTLTTQVIDLIQFLMMFILCAPTQLNESNQQLHEANDQLNKARDVAVEALCVDHRLLAVDMQLWLGLAWRAAK